MTILKQSELPTADLPLEALRAHLRLGTGFGEDTLQDPVLESFLRAAMATIEAQTAKALVAREVTLTITDWARCDGQPLPIAPVLGVQSLRFLQPDGAISLLDTESWRLRKDDAVPMLVSATNHFPTPPAGAEIEIRFLAGFGTWQEVPADLQQAVMLLAAHYYDNRSATRLRAGCMPFGVTALLEPYRLRRVGFGGAK